ncbi:unnamed protein product [Pseudo-nitzschia multistriata]|uniref:DUF1989 domain-containing protein n=1 Tax=Pseudo-nitzschia multistriata TaxID=183589 RepID=A0A448ZHN7_9STRA|nr:unnamed protein product [Pseudo-nitzschia multistriata]
MTTDGEPPPSAEPGEAPPEAAAAATAAAKGISPRRELARNTRPIPCYRVDQLPPRFGSDDLYERILPTAVETGSAVLVERFSIPPRSALSWRVPSGHLWRIVCTHGPQVADMNCWAEERPLGNRERERFYSSKTRQIHATHLSTGDRLWSSFPYLRPMATITHETIQYGFDDDGAGVHDVIGSRCDPYTHHYMTCKEVGRGRGSDSTTPVNTKTEWFNCTCHSNLTRRAIADGLKESDVHDVLNVFMCTGFTRDTHQYFTKPSPVDVGDYIEFLAEIDLLVSASTCPQGDVSIACGETAEPVCYPLGVEVYRLKDSGLLEAEGWRPSPVSGYGGNHGL